MDKKKTILLTIAGVIIIGLIIFIIIVKTNKETHNNTIDGVNNVNLTDVTKEQTIDNLLFSDVSLIVINGESNFRASITNQSQTEYQINNLYVNFQGDNLEHKILALSNITLAKGESAEIRLTIDADLTSVKSVKYLLENTNQ